MGNYKEIDGDLVEMFKKGEFDVIAHGCNCYATMGAGIALTIGNEFPEAKLADEMLDIPNGMKRLGKLSYTEIDIDKKAGYDTSLLFNLYTQYNPGRDFRIKGFTQSLKNMRKVIKDEFAYINDKGKKEFLGNKVRIGLPLIGCGIAGGDWKEVSEIIKTELSEFDVTIIHFKDKVLGVNYFPPRKKTVMLAGGNNSFAQTSNRLPNVSNDFNRQPERRRPKVDWNDLSDEEFEKLLKEM